jgi:hypothetical protein
MATSAGATRAADTITFAHNSERQFARLLDFYRVEWEYEPTAFPIEWDAAGHAVQHFRPDFYLPRFGLYIEITTLNQRLVTKKNRKVRRLRELYPDVRIKVLYQRDYLSLLAKYGLEPPSQMVDDPARERDAAGEGDPAARGGDPAAGEGDPAAGEGEPAAPEGDPAPEQGPKAAGASDGPRPAAQPARTGPERGGSGLPVEPRRAGERPDGVPGRPDRVAGRPDGAAGRPDPVAGRPGRAVERARAAGRPRVVPDPTGAVPPLPADPELVRLAQVLLPAERAHRRGPATAKRAG